MPSSQVVFVGEEAVFRCHHSTSRLIDWRVNRTLLDRPPPSYILLDTVPNEDGTLVNILTITARPEYNETVVECEAVFRNAPPELSPAAILQGNYDLQILNIMNVKCYPSSGNNILYIFVCMTCLIELV